MKYLMLNLAAILLCVLSRDASAQVSAAQTTSTFRAGAAKVDITPSIDELPNTYGGILDRIYARAIVVDNGTTAVALVTLDAGAIPDPLWQAVSKGVEELGIPSVNLVLTATHSHSVPPSDPKRLAEKVVAAVREAKAKLQTARMGFGSGESYINVNRNIIDPKTHRWWEGPNYDGPSDKTVGVIKFETPTGTPIAVFYNYAMHAVAVGQLDLVSGDAPGAASRYVEDSFDDKIVAIWSEGAAGDQNPRYFQQTYDLREIRIKEYAKRGEDISNAMPPGGQGLNRQDPVVAKLMDQQKQMILSMGQFLGEEVLRVMRGVVRTNSSPQIFAKQTTVSCPGRERLDSGRAGYAGSYKDAAPIDLRLSLVILGEVAIGGVNAEVFNLIAQRFKKESPFTHTMMATLTNGLAKSGYIPNDAAFGYNTFEVVSSRLKPGCAETAIVEGLMNMMPSIKY